MKIKYHSIHALFELLKSTLLPSLFVQSCSYFKQTYIGNKNSEDTAYKRTFEETRYPIEIINEIISNEIINWNK